MFNNLALFGLPGGAEWIAIAVVALLLFGKRLPDVARSIGRSIVEFKKGINEVSEDVDKQSRLPSSPTNGSKNTDTTPSASQKATESTGS